MKVLITGSLGLVGSACVELFCSQGWEAVGVDNNGRSKNFGTPKKRAGLDVSALAVDIRDEEKINTLFQGHTFDAVIHAAGQPSHTWANDHVLEDFDINARGTLILLEATRTYCPNATFVYVSSDIVYGDNMKRELTETETRYHSDKPFDESLGLDFTSRSIFGCSKTAADLYVQEYARYFGLTTGVFRPGCITGKNHEGSEFHGFLAYIAKCIKEAKKYTIFGYKGKQVRDQIHANDLARAFYAFVEKPHKGEVYNMGGGPERSISMLEASKLITEKTGFPFIYEVGEGRISDRQWDVHDVSKFKSHYPEWDYQYTLDDIINDVISK